MFGRGGGLEEVVLEGKSVFVSPADIEARCLDFCFKLVPDRHAHRCGCPSARQAFVAMQ